MEFDLDVYTLKNRCVYSVMEAMVSIREKNMIEGSVFTKMPAKSGTSFECVNEVPVMLRMFLPREIVTEERVGEADDGKVWHRTKSLTGVSMEIVTYYLQSGENVNVYVNVKTDLSLPYLVKWGFQKYLTEKATSLRVIEHKHSHPKQ